MHLKYSILNRPYICAPKKHTMHPATLPPTDYDHSELEQALPHHDLLWVPGGTFTMGGVDKHESSIIFGVKKGEIHAAHRGKKTGKC